MDNNRICHRLLFHERSKQYLVSAIPSDFSRLNHCNSFSCYRASPADSYTYRRKKKRSQKIADLPTVVTWRSGTSAMLSSKFNGPIAHGSTR